MRDSPEPPQFIFWYHDTRQISYDSPRGGVSQITEKGENRYFLLKLKELLNSFGEHSIIESSSHTIFYQLYLRVIWSLKFFVLLF